MRCTKEIRIPFAKGSIELGYQSGGRYKYEKRPDGLAFPRDGMSFPDGLRGTLAVSNDQLHTPRMREILAEDGLGNLDGVQSGAQIIIDHQPSAWVGLRQHDQVSPWVTIGGWRTTTIDGAEIIRTRALPDR